MSSHRTLYLFNPENDLALALGTANYTPAANVKEFHMAGAMLPLWYSKGVEASLIGDKKYSEWMLRKCHEFGFTADIIDKCYASVSYEAMPWGWSANAVRQLVNAGMDRNTLPTDGFIDKMRMLSHRRSAAWIADKLRDRLDYPLPAVPLEAVSVEQVMDFVTIHNGGFMKSPWSGSGRGVIDTTLIPIAQLRKTAEGIIHRQRSVMIEPRLNKVMDFAMLFRSTPESGVRHLGYSVFFNETANAYGGNRIMSDERLSDMIASKVGADALLHTASAIVPLLDELLASSGYSGYFGVDMMVYKASDGAMLIYPTVEINLRMTMGIVSWHLYHDVMQPGAEGTLRVRYAPSQPIEDDYVVSGGRLTGGIMSLIPPHRGFRITLSVD